MYIMCVCLFSALSRRVGALQISIIIIINEWLAGNERMNEEVNAHVNVHDDDDWCY